MGGAVGIAGLQKNRHLPFRGRSHKLRTGCIIVDHVWGERKRSVGLGRWQTHPKRLARLDVPGGRGQRRVRLRVAHKLLCLRVVHSVLVFHKRRIAGIVQNLVPVQAGLIRVVNQVPPLEFSNGGVVRARQSKGLAVAFHMAVECSRRRHGRRLASRNHNPSSAQGVQGRVVGCRLHKRAVGLVPKQDRRERIRPARARPSRQIKPIDAVQVPHNSSVNRRAK